MEVVRSSETSVNIRTTRRYMPEDGNFHKSALFSLIDGPSPYLRRQRLALSSGSTRVGIIPITETGSRLRNVVLNDRLCNVQKTDRCIERIIN
jgi:hypothetical protein